MYLLHGTSGTASDWTVMGNAEPATAGLPLIVVMPDIALNDGGGGYCTNLPNRVHHRPGQIRVLAVTSGRRQQTTIKHPGLANGGRLLILHE